tara:strand:- start:8349 stop:8561 length:213 start_codon:yes stop_codon:yes gene_type:complete
MNKVYLDLRQLNQFPFDNFEIIPDRRFLRYAEVRDDFRYIAFKFILFESKSYSGTVKLLLSRCFGGLQKS